MSDLRDTTGTILGVDQTAIHDGPGVRMNVYLKGCPLHCIWCHSPESQRFQPEVVWYETRCLGCGRCVQVCPQGVRTLALMSPAQRDRCTLCGACIAACAAEALAIAGRQVTAGEIVDEALRLVPFFARTGGGVTLTGGEPTAQPDFAYAIGALCHDAGIAVALETCGAAPWEVFQRLLPVVELFLFDLKHPRPAAHRELTGADLAVVLDNLRHLVAAGAQVTARVPLIPGINDDEPTVRALARLAAERGVRTITLLPYNPATPGKYSWLRCEPPLPGAQRQSPGTVARLEAICRQEGLTVVPA